MDFTRSLPRPGRLKSSMSEDFCMPSSEPKAARIFLAVCRPMPEICFNTFICLCQGDIIFGLCSKNSKFFFWTLPIFLAKSRKVQAVSYSLKVLMTGTFLITLVQIIVPRIIFADTRPCEYSPPPSKRSNGCLELFANSPTCLNNLLSLIDVIKSLTVFRSTEQLSPIA